MQTIIKGKNIKNNYKLDNDDNFYMFRIWMGESDKITRLQNNLHHESFTKIKTIQEFVSYDTYATLQDVGYRLNIGEEYERDIIENVEGTEGGDLVYYTSKILSVDENLEEKNRLLDILNGNISKIEFALKEAILERDKKKWYQFWKQLPNKRYVLKDNK